MLLYSIVTFLAAALIFVFGIMVSRGRTDLIHEYHQKNVDDSAAYGKSFGRALLVMAAGLLLSSVTSLIGYPKPAVAILIVGLIIGIALLVAVQIKHNGGIF